MEMTTFLSACAWHAAAAWWDQGAPMPRLARASTISAGTQDGQGTSRPGRAGMCSTWTGRPARASSSRMPSARFPPAWHAAGLAGDPVGTGSGGTRIIVDTGFQCVIRGGMYGEMISYRHDVGAWLNAERVTPPYAGSARSASPGRDVEMTP